jgi:hypothetical protein
MREKLRRVARGKKKCRRFDRVLGGVRSRGSMDAPERMHIDHGRLQLTVPAHGLAVVAVARSGLWIVVRR